MNWPAIAASIVVIAGSGCSELKADGPCTYTRTVTTSYVCLDKGHIEHRRLAPGELQ